MKRFILGATLGMVSGFFAASVFWIIVLMEALRWIS
jgi:hypothetical protein